MRHTHTLILILAPACAGPASPDPERFPDATLDSGTPEQVEGWIGQRLAISSSGGSSCATEHRDAGARPILYVSWVDCGATEPSHRVIRSYDERGNLLSELQATGDEEPHGGVRWEWDEQDRPVLSESWGFGSDHLATYTYGEDGRLFELLVDLTQLGEEPENLYRYAWEDGRLVQIEGMAASSGTLMELWERHYEAAAPGLDHVETKDSDLDGSPNRTTLRSYDADGHLLSEVHESEGQRSSLRQSWQGDLLVERETLRTNSHQFETWSYDDRGLPLEETERDDNDNDGVVDREVTAYWTWTAVGSR